VIFLVTAALLAAEQAPDLGDAVQAMQAGRLAQAELILDVAVKGGVQGEQVDRLLAELAFRKENWPDARSRYARLAELHPLETLTLERLGIAAIKLRELDRAAAALKASTALPGASWRAWNARGALADLRRDWGDADLAYARALELAPAQAQVRNNFGWSMLLRGQWADALAQLEQAVALDPASPRIANNLELARAALDQDLPRRRPGESDPDWAARLNDAGVLAAGNGDRQRAVAAFAQAIELSARWFDRAANNLELVQGQ
jgi:Flp pilus assembly protein TadD